MEPQQLFLKGSTTPILPHLCGKCGRIWESEDSAERCCRCSFCGGYCDWQKAVSHDECQAEASIRADEKALADAVLVPDYEGPFLYDGHDSTVYTDIDDLLESVDAGSLPDFGFCTNYQAPTLSLADIVENVGEGMHTDWEAEDVPQLEEAIEMWNTANAHNGTYWEDRTRKWSKAEILKRRKGGDGEDSSATSR